MLLIKHLRARGINQKEQKFWFSPTFQVLPWCISKPKEHLLCSLPGRESSYRYVLINWKSKDGASISETNPSKWQVKKMGPLQCSWCCWKIFPRLPPGELNMSTISLGIAQCQSVEGYAWGAGAGTETFQLLPWIYGDSKDAYHAWHRNFPYWYSTKMCFWTLSEKDVPAVSVQILSETSTLLLKYHGGV